MPKRRDKGGGSVYQRADGRWAGSVDNGLTAAGKRRRKTVYGDTKAEATRRLAEARRQIETAGAAPTGTWTVKRWVEQWVERKPMRPKTRQGYRSHVQRHIIPTIGHLRLDRLTPDDVRKMKTYLTTPNTSHRRGKALAGSTALKAHRVLSAALKDAEREGLVFRNVATLTDAPSKGRSNPKALTADQGIALLHHIAGDRLASRWALALLTGARQGELLGLSLDHIAPDKVDLAWQLQRLGYIHGCDGAPLKPTCGRKKAGFCPAKLLEVDPEFEHRRLDGALTLTRPKTQASFRVLPNVEPLASFIRVRAAVALGEPNPHGLLFTRDAETGRPIDPRQDYQAWIEMLEAAGLPRVKLHEARNTTASLLLRAGVDPKVVQEILGHSQVTMTQGYQVVDLTLMADAMGRLGRMLQIED